MRNFDTIEPCCNCPCPNANTEGEANGERDSSSSNGSRVAAAEPPKAIGRISERTGSVQQMEPTL